MSEESRTRRTKSFLWKIKELAISKDALIFLMFFVLAGIFWFVQSLDRQREASLRISIDYMGIPEDIVIDNKLPKQVVIRVRDEGIALLQYSRRNLVPLALDMDRIYFEKGEFVITADQLKNRLSRYVLPTTAVLNISPDSIHVRYYKLSNKTLPVKVKSNISFASQHIMSSDILVTPSTVKVFGPQSALDTMTAIYTEKIELRSLSDTTHVKAKLEKNKSGIKYAFDNVNVSIFVEMFTENKKQIPVTIINAPSGINVRIFPATVNVSYNVGLSNYNRIRENDIQLLFDYNKAKELKGRYYKLQIINNSPYISNPRLSPEEIEFLFEEK